MPTEIPYWVPFATALAGGGLVGIINFAKDWLNRKSEEQRHLRELMFNAAVENWKQACAFAIEQGKMGHNSQIAPLESFIIQMMKLSSVLMREPVTKENITDKLKELKDFSDTVAKFFPPPSQK